MSQERREKNLERRVKWKDMEIMSKREMRESEWNEKEKGKVKWETTNYPSMRQENSENEKEKKDNRDNLGKKQITKCDKGKEYLL